MQQDFKSFAVSSTTPVVMAAAGRNAFIHTIVIPKGTAGTVTIANSNSSPTTRFTLPAATVAGTYILDSTFSDGVTITNSAAADLVIVNGYQI